MKMRIFAAVRSIGFMEGDRHRQPAIREQAGDGAGEFPILREGKFTRRGGVPVYRQKCRSAFVMRIFYPFDLLPEALPHPLLIIVVQPIRRGVRSKNSRPQDTFAPRVAMRFPCFRIGEIFPAAVSAGFHGVMPLRPRNVVGLEVQRLDRQHAPPCFYAFQNKHCAERPANGNASFERQRGKSAILHWQANATPITTTGRKLTGKPIAQTEGIVTGILLEKREPTAAPGEF